MRDYVEIGLGRQARRAYRLDDIAVVPRRRTRSSKDVNTAWHFDAYTFDLPFVSVASDALASPEFIIEMDKQGGLGVINAEGLWGRHADLEGAIRQVTDAANRDNPGDTGAVSVLQKLHAAELDTELLSERIAQVRAAGATVAVRVSPQHARELAPVVIKAGAEILFIQGTIISAEHVQQGGEPLNLKEFVGSLEVPVVAGGVTDYTTALHLMRSGVAGVIVGGGENTSDDALGIDSPMATAIADVAAARRDYLDETEGRYVHIIADGEISKAGDVVKAIACGADAAMLGAPLMMAAEAAGVQYSDPEWGRAYFWPSAAAHPRFPRGFVFEASLSPFAEDAQVKAPSLEKLLHGPSVKPFGTENFGGGLKRALAKCGFSDLKSFHKVDLTLANHDPIYGWTQVG